MLTKLFGNRVANYLAWTGVSLIVAILVVDFPVTNGLIVSFLFPLALLMVAINSFIKKDLQATVLICIGLVYYTLLYFPVLFSGRI